MVLKLVMKDLFVMSGVKGHRHSLSEHNIMYALNAAECIVVV